MATEELREISRQEAADVLLSNLYSFKMSWRNGFRQRYHYHPRTIGPTGLEEHDNDPQLLDPVGRVLTRP